jgi:hypothetical protein
MTSLIIDAGVTALVHDRLKVLASALGRKQGRQTFGGRDLSDDTATSPVQVSVVERQIAELCRRAIAIFEGGPRGPTPPGAPHTSGTSKYAILGSAATVLPSLSDIHRNSHAWLSQVLRRGAPDPAQSQVIAPAVDTALLTAQRALGAGTGDARDAAAARAFAIGMLCGVAADVVVSPLLRGADGPPPRDTASPEIDPALIARVDAAVLRNVFGTISTSDFLSYWPEVDDLRAPLISGFLDAVTAAALPFHDPTRAAFTADGLHDAYKLLRASATSWGFWQWAGWLLFYTVPLGLVLPLAAAFPESDTHWRASRLFRPESPGVTAPGEEGWSQLVSLALAGSSIGPAVTTLWLALEVPGMGGAAWLGALAFAIDAIGAALLGASVHDGSWGEAARWVPIALQAAMRVVFLVLALVESGPISTFYWIQTVPLWTTLAAVLFTWLADAVTNDRDGDGSTKGADRNRIILLIAWPVVLLAAQVIAALSLRGGSLVSRLLGSGWDALPALDALTAADPPYAVARVHDESTLWSVDPARRPQSVLDLRYPPGSRPLIEMWWTGAAGLQINHAGRQLQFRIGPTGAVQQLAIPPIAMTPAELATWLQDHVAPGGAPAGQLHARPVLAGDSPEAAHRLPWPEVVENIGTDFRDVGDASHTYVMNHATRRQLTVPLGQRGPAVAVGEGWPVGPGAGLGGADGTGTGMAAELGVLLSLGAASRIHDPATVPGAAPAIGPISQVFRRWNLDDRRANEWRMLITGGASSEKPPRVRPAPPATETVPPDAALIAGATASPAVIAGSEDLSNLLGWVPLFRAWTRVASDIEQDATAEIAAPYNPRIRRDGRWVQPTNRQLTDAVRYLLDL